MVCLWPPKFKYGSPWDYMASCSKNLWRLTCYDLYNYIDIFSRLYKAGSSFQGGTLLQLCNLINRRNVSADISGKFNEAVDFFQLVVECHIMVAAMHFFSLKTLDDTPSTNKLPSMVGKKPSEQWKAVQVFITELVDRYVLVDKNTIDLSHKKVISALLKVGCN